MSILGPTGLVSTLLYLLFSSLRSCLLISCTVSFVAFLFVPVSLAVTSQTTSLHYLCLFIFSIIPSHPVPPCLYVPAGRLCGAAWSRGSWAWLNCSKIAASLQRFHYSSGATLHCVGECVCGTRKGGVWQEGTCVYACIWTKPAAASDISHKENHVELLALIRGS